MKQAKRLCAAVVCVTAALLLVVASDRVVGSAASPVVQDAGANGQQRAEFSEDSESSTSSAKPESLECPESSAGFSSEDVAKVLFRKAGGASVEWGSVPEAFTRQVFDPVALGADQVASAQGCVGASFAGDVDSVGQLVGEALERNGWRRASENADAADGLYFREGDPPSWIYVQCSESASCTCVTVSVWEGGS